MKKITKEIMNTINIMFNGEKIHNPQGELKSIKLTTIWGGTRYIVVQQLENPSEFSVDIYDYWSLLQTKIFTKKKSIVLIAQKIGQYITE